MSPGTTFQCLVDELHAELCDVVVERIGVVANQFNVSEGVLLAVTTERRYTAQPTSNIKQTNKSLSHTRRLLHCRLLPRSIE